MSAPALVVTLPFGDAPLAVIVTTDPAPVPVTSSPITTVELVDWTLIAAPERTAPTLVAIAPLLRTSNVLAGPVEVTAALRVTLLTPLMLTNLPCNTPDPLLVTSLSASRSRLLLAVTVAFKFRFPNKVPF